MWLVTFVTLTNHNITSGFLLSLSRGCFVFLYTCDIVVGQYQQCHQPQCHPDAIHNYDSIRSGVKTSLQFIILFFFKKKFIILFG